MEPQFRHNNQEEDVKLLKESVGKIETQLLEIHKNLELMQKTLEKKCEVESSVGKIDNMDSDKKVKDRLINNIF